MNTLTLKSRLSVKVALAALVFVCMVGLSEAKYLKGGKFYVDTFDGERVDLHDYVGDGKWTLVMYWGLNCSACELQKPKIESLHQTHSDKIRVLGLVQNGINELEDINRVLDGNKVSFLNLLALSDVIEFQFLELTQYQLQTTPAYLLYKPDGSYYKLQLADVSISNLMKIVGQ